MYKKSLLSSMATAAIVLFNIQFNVHAESLEVSGEKKEVKDATYETLHVLKEGQVTGTDLKVTGNKDTNSSSNTNVYVISTEGKGSAIKLTGDKTTIKGTDSDIRFGLEAKDDAILQMTGGTISVSNTGVHFLNSNNTENKLENVIIMDANDDLQMLSGIVTENSNLILKKITVHAFDALKADDHSQITILGGEFNGEVGGVSAKQGSIIDIKDNAKITSSLYAGLHSDGSESIITMTGGIISGFSLGTLFAENGSHIDVTDVVITSKDNTGTGAFAENEGSVIELHDTTIKDISTGINASKGGTIKITGGSITASIMGGNLYYSDNQENKLENVLISGSKDNEIQFVGLYVNHKSNLSLKDVTITQANQGIYSHDHSQVTVSGGSVSANTVGIYAESGSIITLKDKAKIISSNGAGLYASDLQSKITMIEGTVNAKEAALYTTNGGHIDVENISAIAKIGGLQLASILFTPSNGLHDPKNYQNSEINLTNTKIHVDNGAGILIGTFSDNTIKNIANLSIGTANLINSEIHADVLLGNGTWGNKEFLEAINAKAIPKGSFTLNADHSTLEGRANIAKERNVRFNLKNGTQWILKNSTQEKDADGNLLNIAQRARSDISVLNLENSSVIFKEPTEDHYHTLHIGSGNSDTKSVYNATGDAQISFNTWWSDGKPIAEQKTDRLLINGNVSGNTNVLVNLKGNVAQKKPSDVERSVRGLSLIQVSGTAEEGSFKLAHGYTTINGSPDKYMLRAYGPNSSQGKANIEQSLFDERDENFWDFRLQPEFLNSKPGSGSNPESGSSPEENVHAPVPQMASYLVMPNALFYSGLTDMAKQNALLANLRTAVIGKQQEKQNGFFLHTYGSTGTFSSENAPRQYGYSGAHLRYAALQGGVNFAALEGQNTTTHLGLLGTYGQLSFTPKDMKDASKSTMDKWSLTAYGTIQHNSGFYLDALLSYGFLKGKITNALIGTTAKLKNAKMLSISTTVGKQFATGIQGVTFEPQAQLAYQHLMFDTIKDADNLTIDMQNPSQWLIRVGGRLTKTVASENSRPMSFYGKVNLIKTFGDDQALHIDKDYKRDPMGSFLEGGLGINAQLSAKLSLHGDVSYQQKLQKTGISGASFSGGIRYQF